MPKDRFRTSRGERRGAVGVKGNRYHAEDFTSHMEKDFKVNRGSLTVEELMEKIDRLVAAEMVSFNRYLYPKIDAAVMRRFKTQWEKHTDGTEEDLCREH